MRTVPLAIAAVITFAACGGDTTGVDGGQAAALAGGRDAPAAASRGDRGVEKVAICHRTDDGDTGTLMVPEKAVPAHLRHGDARGPCEGDDEGSCEGEPYVDPDGCSPDLLLRTSDVVVSDLRAALAAEDWAAVACNYHPDAFVIDDQGVLLGRSEIVAGAQSLHDLFDGVQPDITNEVLFRDVVRTLFTLDGGWIVIPDGVHTYVIENGMIMRQTTHGIIEFTGPPPDQT